LRIRGLEKKESLGEDCSSCTPEPTFGLIKRERYQKGQKSGEKGKGEVDQQPPTSGSTDKTGGSLKMEENNVSKKERVSR